MTQRGAGASLPRLVGGAMLPPLLILVACARDPAPAEAGAMLARVLENHRASVDASLGLPARVSGASPESPERPGERTGQPVRPVAAAGLAAVPREAAALLEQSSESLLRLLGPPALRRREGDAEIWLYDAGACQLDLILYPNGGAARVGWAAARAAGTGRVTEAACLGAVARRTRPAAGTGA